MGCAEEAIPLVHQLRIEWAEQKPKTLHALERVAFSVFVKRRADRRDRSTRPPRATRWLGQRLRVDHLDVEDQRRLGKVGGEWLDRRHRAHGTVCGEDQRRMPLLLAEIHTRHLA